MGLFFAEGAATEGRPYNTFPVATRTRGSGIK